MLTRQGTVKMLNFGTGYKRDTRVDVYSAGRLLVELLTGSPPAFGAPTPQGLPPRLETVIRTAMHPDLTERYQTATELMHALIR